MVSEKKIFLCFSYYKPMGANAPGHGQFGNDWQDLCRVPLNILHTKYTFFMPCCFREEDFFIFSHYKPMVDDDAPNPPGMANLNPRDTVGSKGYKEGY